MKTTFLYPIIASAVLSSSAMANHFNSPFWILDSGDSSFMKSAYSSSSMSEEANRYVISVDLPGIDKKDINIETISNNLIISASREDKKESKVAQKRLKREYKQSFLLPNDANMDAITATNKNGVLEIVVPKTKGAKKSKKIEIK